MQKPKDSNTFYRFKYIAVISFLATINHGWVGDSYWLYSFLTFVCLPIILFSDIIKNINPFGKKNEKRRNLGKQNRLRKKSKNS